ncbi:zinc ABC transporter substrate-binding protein, partial [Salmonella enterica subsp. enterica serovar Kentucky]|nr:zinc ABC transporter substrate-binding protein [Salmonella enterica subsp. enterica serovar Kentucky]
LLNIQVLGVFHFDLFKYATDQAKVRLATNQCKQRPAARSHQQQGTPKQVRKVIDTIKKHHIPAIFSESTVSDKPARQVARESGAHYGGVLYVDSLSAADGPVPTYLDLLRVTTETIVNGINDGLRSQQ